MHLYRDYASQEEIDAQLNIGASLPGWERYLDRYIADSEASRKNLACALDVSYGPTLDEYLDIFPSPKENSPVLLFIHGGYWRALSSREFSFIADTFVKHGVTVVVSNYSLCPKVSIAEITRQQRAVVAWMTEHISAYNGDPEQLYVSGHSAGGHLTAMLACTPWQADYGLARNTIKGAIPISGIFDLRPFRYCYLQPILQLSHELIREQSPVFHVPGQGPELLITLGDRESEEFHLQAGEFQQAWQNRGMDSVLRDEKDDDHFSILYTLVDEKSELFRAVLAMLQSG